MIIKKIVAALIAGAFLTATAYAADEKKAAEASPAKSDSVQEGAQPKAKRHNHAAEGGRGTASEAGAASSGKKPLHNHNKEHKQQ